MPRNHLRLSPWIWLAGLAAVLSLHFWFPQLSRRPMNDTYSTERAGKKAFYLLAERRFDSVSRNGRSPVGAVANLEQDGFYYQNRLFCLLGPSRYPDRREWKLLLDWVAQGGSLVVAPRHGEPSLTIEELDLRVEPLVDFDLDLSKILEQARQQEAENEDVNTSLFGGGELRWRSFGKVSGEGGKMLVEFGGEPQAVVKDHGFGKVLLLASDEIFSNGSLAYKDNGVLAQRLLEAVSGPDCYILFDEYFNTIGAPKIVGLLFDPLLRPLTVQALAVLLLFTWCGSRRFGRLSPRLDSARHNVADHTDALGNLYYRSGDGRAAVRVYYEQLRMELRLRHISPGNAQAIDALARRAGKDPDRVKKLLKEAEAAVAAVSLKRRAAAEIIRRLAELRAGIKRRGA